MRLGVTKGGTLPGATTNKAGGVAYTIADPTARLLHLIGSLFNEPTYYGDEAEGELTSEAKALIAAAAEALSGPNPEDVFAIARWARTDGNLRTTPTVVLAVGAEDPHAPDKKRRHGALVKKYAPAILQRGDEWRNVIAAWLALYGRADGHRSKMVPKALARAIGSGLAGLSEKTLAKWDGTGTPSLSDVIRLCARDRLREAKLLYFVNREKWAERKAETPTLLARERLFASKEWTPEMPALADAAGATWEDVTSRFGSKPEVWSWASSRMGYMALLRNLRNLVKSGADMGPILAKIADREEVLKSRQLPFRFLSAARIFSSEKVGRAVKDVEQVESPWNQKILDALDVAARAACENLPKIPGVTAVFVDDSGSMSNPLSANGSVSIADSAGMLASILGLVCEDVHVFAFSDGVRAVNYRRADSILTNMGRIVSARGGSTNAFLCPLALLQVRLRVDRMILLSDMQCWDSYGYRQSFPAAVSSYRGHPNGNKMVWLHSINLAGTEQAQAESNTARVNLLSGFSEKLVAMIVAAEQGAAPEGASEKAVRAVPTLAEIREKWYVR